MPFPVFSTLERLPDSEYDAQSGFTSRFDSARLMPMSSLHTQVQSPSASDWQKFREEITALYLNNNLTLADLRKIMEDKYGFKATPRMYKTRFDQWGLHKNVNEKLKAAMLKTSSSPPQAMSRACRLRLSRMSAQVRYSQKAANLMISRVMYISSDDRHVEAVLAHLKMYYEVGPANTISSFYETQNYTSDNLITACRAPNFNSSLFFKGSRPQGPWDLCNRSLVHLQNQDFVLAGKTLSRACEGMQDVLRSKPQDFFRKIFMVLGARGWSRFGEARQRILNFSASMSSKILGSEHPLSITLAHLQDVKCLDKSAEPSLRYLVQILPKRLGHGHQEVLLLQDSLAVILIRQERYEKAEAVLINAAAESESYHGFHHEHTRIYLRRLANMYLHQEKWAKGEETCKNILHRDELAVEAALIEYENEQIHSHTARPRPALKESSVRTMQDLAFLAAQRGDFDECEEWLQRAAHVVSRLFTLHEMQDMLSEGDCGLLPDYGDPLACARRVLDCCSPVWCCGDKKMP